MKEFADDNFKFDENGRKLSKGVENTVGKGEIARYEQFLLFPQCFQEACFQGASKGVIVWEWVNFCTFTSSCTRASCLLILITVKVNSGHDSHAFFRATDKCFQALLTFSKSNPGFYLSSVQVF